MATEYNFTAADEIFIGEDKVLRFPIYTDDAATAVVDVTGWALQWTQRKHDAAVTALIEKSTETSPPGITLEGVYNSDPAVNTQEVVIHLEAADSYDPAASPPTALKAGTYRHGLRRTDSGFQTQLSYGDIPWLRSTTP